MQLDLKKQKLQKGDKLLVNINAYAMNESYIKKFSKTNFTLVLGANLYIPSFDNALIGLNIQPIIDIVQKYDENYPLADYKNSKIRYIIEILDYETASNFAKTMELDALKKEYQEYKSTTTAALEKSNRHELVVTNLKNKIEELTKELDIKEKSKYSKDNKDNKSENDVKVIERLTIPKEELEKARKYALQKFFEDFGSQYSTLKRAIKMGEMNSNPVVANYVKGFDMISKNLENVFTKHGISLIEPQIGEVFDPNKHKILEMTEDDSKPEFTITSTVAIGFQLYERVIQAALVNVTKLSEKAKKAVDEKKAEEAKKLAEVKTAEEAKKEEPEEKQEEKSEENSKNDTKEENKDKENKLKSKSKKI